ncbi:MAG: hypothetical protein D6790_02215, partial [Caldilineae bacterium]
PLIAISGEPGDPHFAVASTEWQEGIGAWQFGLSTSFATDQVRMAFYTDRPIYRPGQKVFWKGIVRGIEEDKYVLPPEGMLVHVIVRDDRGNIILEQDFPTNEHGTVNGELTLAEEAPTGYYSLEAQVQLGPDRYAYGSGSFQVAEYRVPEFQISVRSEEPSYVQGDTVSVVVEASYFSGGPLANAPVSWRLLAEPYNFHWEDAPKGRFYSFAPANEDDALTNPFGGFSGGLLQEGEGVTDDQGRFVIQLPADVAEASRSQTWTFDVTVQSPTNQFVSGRTSVPVHRSNVYIGVSPRRYLGVAGEEMAFDLVTLTPQAEPVGDVPLTAVVYDYRWNSVYEQSAEGGYYWRVSVEKTPVFTTSVATGAGGTGELLWTPEEGGQYFVTLAGEDAAGNPTDSGVFVWVRAARADAFIPWRRENNDRIELVADKELYAPGDTAEILVPSPFTGPVYALVTLERGGILERSVRVLESNSEVLRVPITEDHIPNVYVSVVLVKGVDETNPAPAMRVGYVLLPVDAAAKELSIQVETSVAQARPGDTVAYTVTVRDAAGQPVAGAELSAALADKGVLSLAMGDTRTLLEQFYYEQPLGVTTGALLVINQDRLNQQLSEGGKGGGGGGGPGGGLIIRQNFADLAYWKADLVTDEAGMAHFSVTLPDNLTTWRLVVRAVSDETRVGDGVHDLVSTKELLIRPILPRFFTAGDRAQIGAVVQNTTRLDLGSVELTMDISGARFIGVNEPETVNVGPGGQVEFTRLIQVEDATESVVVTFTAVAATFDDAVRLSLPVHRYATPETVGTTGVVPPAGRLEAILVPEQATDQGELTVKLQPSLAAGMIDGLNYLKHYPYECVEQTVSRFLPNLFTALALQRLGVENPNLEVELAFQLGVGLQKLINWQNPDGGWGWWSHLRSDRYITAYVLWGLWTAKEAGYPVPENTIADALFFLDQGWKAPAQVRNVWELNQMAFIHFVLSEMGEGDPGR